MNELVTIAEYAQRIRAAWRRSAESIIEVGQLLARAKAELDHGSWLTLLDQSDLPFKPRIAQYLMEIARDQRLVNPKTISLLPADWSTIHAYSRIRNDEDFERMVNERQSGAQARQHAKTAARNVRERELGEKQASLPDKKYGVIVADPEWRFEPWSRTTGMDRAADNHYPTSCLEVIASRDVDSIAADDSALGLWGTVPMLREALAVMEAWGFEYKTHWAWAKDRIGTGYWNRNAHEIFLLGTRGKIPAPAMGTQWKSIIEAPAARHSAKPEIFLQMMEQYFPTLPKIELNRRGAPRSGWDAWGNEIIESAAMPSAPGAACVDESPLPPAHAGSSYFAESEV